MTHKVFVGSSGQVRFVYSDEVMSALRGLGQANVRRASHVEPLPGRLWCADMAPVNGLRCTFFSRSDALAWEVAELERMGAPVPSDGR